LGVVVKRETYKKENKNDSWNAPQRAMTAIILKVIVYNAMTAPIKNKDKYYT